MSEYKNASLVALSVVIIALFGQAQKQSSIDLTDLVGSFNNASSETQMLLFGIGLFIIFLILIAGLTK